LHKEEFNNLHFSPYILEQVRKGRREGAACSMYGGCEMRYSYKTWKEDNICETQS